MPNGSTSASTGLPLHLGLAILIFGALLWMALSARCDATSDAQAALECSGAAAIVVLVFVQILLGAFVAGLKAGASYNTWPLMDGHLVPDGLGAMQPWYLNLFENALTVQFNHRLVAYVLLLASFWHALVCGCATRRFPKFGSRPGLSVGRCWHRRARHRDLAGTGAAVVGSRASGRRRRRVRAGGMASAPLCYRRAQVGSRHERPVLVFDLDDTLYPERQFALSGFSAASTWAEAELGIAGLAAEMTRLLDGGHLGALFKIALAAKMPITRPKIWLA